MIEIIFDFISAHAGLIGLLFFVIFFAVVVFWTFRPSAKKTYNKNAYIPLEENE